MPSDSYLNFLHMREDVLRLMETHYDYSRNNRGRKRLGHLTRSSVIMLCAAWERYNEDLLLESIKFLADSLTNANLLSKEIRKTINSKVKADKDDSKPIQLAGDGWKSVWMAYAKAETESLNTPKTALLEQLFNKYLGISDYTTLWNLTDPKQIDEFVSTRGDIAHNGNRASYVRMNQLGKYQDLIIQTVINIDGNIADELFTLAGSRTQPWIKDYSRNINYYKP